MNPPSGPPAAPAGHLPESLPGIDLAAFRDMLRGNEGLVRRLLESFFDSYGGIAGDIAADVAAGDFERAVRAAHTLKGVSGNIRATGVFEAVKTLEAALKEAPDSPEVPRLLGDLAGALDQLMAGLRDALGRPPNPSV